MTKKFDQFSVHIPTIKDVAIASNVSLKTVSRVINQSENVNSDTRQRVLSAIKEVGYMPNAIARSLRIRETLSIGVIIADITNSFHNILIKGIEEIASSKNYSILLANSDEMLAKEKMYTKIFVEKQVEGLIIVPSAGSQEYMNSYAMRLPIVFADRKAVEVESSWVSVDNYAGAVAITEHIIQHGHTRIAFVCHDIKFSTGSDRLRAFKDSLLKHNIQLVQELIKTGNRTIDEAYAATIEIINHTKNLQAIFASNNIMALGILKALHDLSLSVPGDIALAVFDDLPFSELFKPSLTSVSQPIYEMGKQAAIMLFNQLEGGIKQDSMILPVKLMIRESCGCSGPNLNCNT